MVEFLRERPMLIPEIHAHFFEGLDRVESLRVLHRLEQHRLVPMKIRLMEENGEGLFELCRNEGLDHAAVVFSVASESDDIGRSIIEKLIGKPINVWQRPIYHRRTVAEERATPRPASTAPTGDMVVLSAVPQNPKKQGTATFERFKHWVAGRTVAQCLAAGLAKADIPWDSDPSRKFVVLGTRAQWDAQQAGGMVA